MSKYDALSVEKYNNWLRGWMTSKLLWPCYTDKVIQVSTLFSVLFLFKTHRFQNWIQLSPIDGASLYLWTSASTLDSTYIYINQAQHKPSVRVKTVIRNIEKLHTHTHSHTLTHTLTHSYSHARTHALTHTHAPTHTHARTRTLSHTHTQAVYHLCLCTVSLLLLLLFMKSDYCQNISHH
jgi:hypothetical protein